MQYHFNGAKFSQGWLSKLGNPRIVDQSQQAYSIALCIWYSTFCSDCQPTEHTVSCYVFDQQGCILIGQSYQVALLWYEMLDTPLLGLHGADPIMYSFA